VRARRILAAALWIACRAVPSGAQHTPQSPSGFALEYFERLPQSDLRTAFAHVRPRPLSPSERDRVRATLPESGELAPTTREAAMIQAARAVLVYHEREDVFEIKLVDLPQAVVGLHGRAILLLSRRALRLLSPAELQAVVAHEVGHEFLWGEFELTRVRRDAQTRQQLELQCDGIAVLTIVALGLEPARLMGALRKLVRYNKRVGATAHVGHYPSLSERERFTRALLTTTLARRAMRVHP
jgi:hypothetical protein